MLKPDGYVRPKRRTRLLQTDPARETWATLQTRYVYVQRHGDSKGQVVGKTDCDICLVNLGFMTLNDAMRGCKRDK